VRRAIWLDDGTIPDGADLVRPAAPEFAAVAAAGRPVEEIAAEVARLDAARSLT
jgi:hypothetical protein